ncbi:sensor histidine kinase [Gallibacterium salpingitidis]|uniref:sensor histidine kinase n=1 Tax=Gallibacterium salpingitidis TaxID=505341 RepID=UPI0009F39972|nr:HAMP domain-containing sensor histidine kinase [Gallibacterium salpingitidis]
MDYSKIARLLMRWRYSIQAKLTLTLVLVTFLTAGITGVTTAYKAFYAAYQLQDDWLIQTARFLSLRSALAEKMPLNDEDNQIYVQTNLTPPRGKYFIPFLDQLYEGFYTVKINKKEFRVYVRQINALKFAVMQETEFRTKKAIEATWATILPFLIFIPLVILLGIIVTNFTFIPLRRLSSAIKQRQENDLSVIPLANTPYEVHNFIEAINHLLKRVDKSVKEQQQFIANAAHELRSPMTVLSLQAERLTTHTVPAETKQQIEHLVEAIQRNRHLLDQLLSFARSQAQSTPTNIDNVSVKNTFKQVIETLLPLAEQKQIDIGVISEQDYSLQISETDLFTMIKILVENAILYTPEGSLVDLSITKIENNIIISVEDNGNGIPIEEYDKVLKPFYRILGTQQQGTGLGLAIVNTLVQHYHGSIQLKPAQQYEHGLRVEIDFISEN